MKVTLERVITALCVAVVAAMVVAVAVTLFNEPEYFPAAADRQARPQLNPDSPPPQLAGAPIRAARLKSPGEALNEGQINHMIGILRSAAIRGDGATRRAMIVGISNHGAAAREPLLAALERETDSKASAAIHEAIDSLGER